MSTLGRLRMSSKRKSPPTKLSEGGGGTGTVAGANEEEEDTTSSVTGGPGGEVAVGEEGPTTPVDIEDCYPHQRGGDCESSGCSSPATTSEPDLRDSPSPSSNSLRTSKRQRIVLTGQEALAYHYPPHHHHHHHHHHQRVSPTSSSSTSSSISSTNHVMLSSPSSSSATTPSLHNVQPRVRREPIRADRCRDARSHIIVPFDRFTDRFPRLYSRLFLSFRVELGTIIVGGC